MADPAVSTVGSIEGWFEHPSVEGFKQPIDFPGLVKYTFERAGYAVKDVSSQYWQGVFELHAGGEIKSKPSAHVWAKQSPNVRIGDGDVASFVGHLALHGVVNGPKYIVTSIGFTDQAYQAAAGVPHLHLIDGEHLARYIAYVRGSRYEHALGHTVPLDHILRADGIKRRQKHQTKVLAVANNKGGEGKTTTALYLARRLADGEKRVLLVDLDAQANLSRAVPLKEGGPEDKRHLADYFAMRCELHELIRITDLSNIWLIPAHRDLRLVDTGTWPHPEDELRFVQDLHGPDVRPPGGQGAEQFDWIILDTPPDMTRHTRAALAAAHYVIAPTSPGPFGDLGLEQLFDTMSAMRGLMGSDVSMLGCLVTKWQDVKAHTDALKQLKQTLNIDGIRVFNQKIPFDTNVVTDERVRFSLASLGKKPASLAYTKLTEEVLEHVGNG